jgi:hypothetical protein
MRPGIFLSISDRPLGVAGDAAPCENDAIALDCLLECDGARPSALRTFRRHAMRHWDLLHSHPGVNGL